MLVGTRASGETLSNSVMSGLSRNWLSTYFFFAAAFFFAGAFFAGAFFFAFDAVPFFFVAAFFFAAGIVGLLRKRLCSRVERIPSPQVLSLFRLSHSSPLFSRL